MLRPLSFEEFSRFQRFIFDAAGITLSGAKQALVSGRLARRLDHHGLASFSDYLRLLEHEGQDAERQMAIDLLTTNETYFFREPRHFETLRVRAAASRASGRPFRVWSAASSSGEEAYSIAMVLADSLGRDGSWEVFGSDISQRVLDAACRGHYPLERARHVPPDFLRRFCRKGQGPQEGTLLVERELRDKVRFAQVNLNQDLPEVGKFDVIFLRNVMIYFDGATKQALIERISHKLQPGGLLLIGHAESLSAPCAQLECVATSTYRRVQ
ncbi:protein-glutamate O-methyltransferase CheR [Massilia sp. TS11]|uniref:CheR family methyltransferase n=1 Tax=Massilia sp. TS11 TaxID=2908003 RepID=UPI001EDBBB7A|nr:protein-glutamate O-methyltransferase CheR [Massilia sp. TS11]MCG2582975.1 protein-glutamate O-methyltransferase CheR [Massilia sp. TS11]